MKCTTNFPPAVGSESEIDIHSVPPSPPILRFSSPSKRNLAPRLFTRSGDPILHPKG